MHYKENIRVHRCPSVVILKNIFIILENPKYAGNIGMVCRLIANFDLPPLRIVGEKKDLHFEMEWMAHNSNEELSKIEYFSEPKKAREDLSLLIGTAMIQGKDRVGFIPLSDLTNKIKSQVEKKVGIVFGREDRGLSNAMIDICDKGLGFPQEVLTVRGTEFISTKGEQGMGIGLFLANATLERLGGDVVFLPREGGGVIARVILPIHCHTQTDRTYASHRD